MTERWICSRCFTSAAPGAAVCPNCGLARGATPEPPPREGDASVAEPVAEPGPASVTLTTPAALPVPSPTAGSGPGERWVCLRCFTSNEATAGECVNCGLARGAEVASADQASWTGTATAPPVVGGRQIPWIRLGIYALIAAVVLGGTYLFNAQRDDAGTITGAGDMSVFDLREGDCFELADGAIDQGSEVSSVRALPCAEPHVYEVFWTGDYSGDNFPSETEADAWAEGLCIPAFEDYVDFAYEDSLYYVSYLSPSENSWGDGDRAFTCYLHILSETPISGSARGAAE